MRQHQIRHLPIVDEQEKLLGIVTHNSLRQALQPANLLKLRLVREVMLTQVIHAPHNASVLDLAQQMSQHRVSCIVIVEAQAAGDSELIYPMGIVSERDIVQFRALNLDLAHTQAVTVMSTPLFTVKPEDSMWAAYQQMQQRYIRRLVVTGDRSELLGIVTQSSFLNAVDPLMDAQGQAIALQYWQRRQPGIKEQHDFKFCDRNGRDVWAIVSGTPMFDENGEYIGGLGMITDITERKQAEQKMREQAALIDIATDAIFLTS